MGREQPTIVLAPASFRKAARAKKAKATLNQLIPTLLNGHAPARRGIEAAELIVEPRPLKEQPTELPTPQLILEVSDTLTAAHALVAENARPGRDRVAILNMASPLNPGGGFVNGAGSQEESLCMRTTLLPSLKDEWYRLPELSAVYTPDVLVFRDEDAEDVLHHNERWYVDCISSAMLRNPETERDDETGFSHYVTDKDRQLAMEKMKVVLRVCQMKGITRIVVGAWGCGAFGNPVGEIAAAWRKVLLPRVDSRAKSKKVRETWNGIERVVFAIKDEGMANAFEEAFGTGLVREEPESENEESDVEADDGEDDSRQQTIRDLQMRVENTQKPELKAMYQRVLDGLVG
ncbi:hypothetical protein C8034_v001941 [Colletotrichum sidae]|uniref:Microbial-type PARG catalytic domain-containing protein n=1 Tax=Colletotrichum sidae TaxID=1347389 RepID=A0A4R8TD64_9PEZI|nr:hypothetical protein C8034_v001941 [Colletotrichum sidae]